MRRPSLLAIVVALALALAGCAALPTSGPVNAGLPVDVVPDGPDFSFAADGPQPGASPEQIVFGFIAAATDSADSWAVARLFLTPAAAERWQPLSGITIDRLPARTITGADDTVLFTFSPVASVDATGAYQIADDDLPTRITYSLAQGADGEWRITEAPDGIVLEEDVFDDVFSPFSIMYFDPTWTYLVPDVRWFASLRSPATRIAAALIEGTPSAWLAGSVSSAFPDDVALAREAVTVTTERIAQVELSDAALDTDQVRLGRMVAQLEASLSAVNVVGVDLLVDGSEIVTTPAPVQSTSVDGRALIDTEAGFGFLSGDELEEVPELSTAIEDLPVTSVELGRRALSAVAQLDSGGVVRIDANGDSVTVDARGALIRPTIGPEGDVWSVPGDRPGGLIAVDADGAEHVIADAFPGATRITSIQLSRDGTRLAATVTTGGREWVTVSGVVRDGDGVPTGIGEPFPVARLDSEGIDLDWLDDRTLGIVVAGAESSIVLQQTVGGVGASLQGPAAHVVTIASGAIAGSPRVLAADGSLYVRRGTTWPLVTEGVRVLAKQLGAR